MSRFLVAICIMISCTFSQNIEVSESETIKFIINEVDSKIVLDYADVNDDATPIFDEIEFLLNQGAFRGFLSSMPNEELNKTNHGEINRVLEYRESIENLLELENHGKKEVLENSRSIWYLQHYQKEESQFIYHTFYYDKTKVFEGLMIPGKETPTSNFLDNENINGVLKNNNIKETEDLYRISFGGLGTNLVVFRSGNERFCIPYSMHEEELELKNESVYPLDEVLEKLQVYNQKKKMKRGFIKSLPYIIRILVGIILFTIVIKVMKPKRFTIKLNRD